MKSLRETRWGGRRALRAEEAEARASDERGAESGGEAECGGQLLGRVAGLGREGGQ